MTPHSELKRVRLTLEYDGTRYCGWQLQVGQDSIQGQLEAALEKIFGAAVRVYGAGRTDSGAHARGQVAAIDLPREFAPGDLRRALNALLPADIAALEVTPAPARFDPRRDALSRVYEYRLLNREHRSVFDYRYAWLMPQPLDFDAMNMAAADFIGEHDFAAFRTLGSDEKTTIRRVFTSSWSRSGAHFVYRVEARSFLRHMVRTMVATMVAIGRGKLAPADVTPLLAGRDRAMVPAAAPACGLFLVAVNYPASWTGNAGDAR